MAVSDVRAITYIHLIRMLQAPRWEFVQRGARPVAQQMLILGRK